jgi:nicotinamide-nucleotide amidase
MKATIILVGTELLSGMTVDTNSIYMAEELNKYGVEI